ncbi:MAG: universal stress protein [Zetaproteobacteria bacterium]|nr:MAG: universal stress protein [Zetaproteobacteria bacterium]
MAGRTDGQTRLRLRLLADRRLLLELIVRPIRHILAPTDFSPSADQAVRTAADLAVKFAADLTLLHIVAPQYYLPEMGEPMMPAMEDLTETLVASAKSRLAELAAMLQPEPRCVVEVSLRKPADAVCHYAAGHGIDLIVIGSHGRTGLMHLLLGATSEHVVRYADCPVLVTKLERNG